MKIRVLSVIAVVGLILPAWSGGSAASPSRGSVHSVCDLHLLKPTEVARAFGVHSANVNFGSVRGCDYRLSDPFFPGSDIVHLRFSNPARLAWGRTGADDDPIAALLADGAAYGPSGTPGIYRPGYCAEIASNLGERATGSGCVLLHALGFNTEPEAALAVIKNETAKVGFSLSHVRVITAQDLQEDETGSATVSDAQHYLQNIQLGLRNLAKIVLRRAGGPPGRTITSTTTVPPEVTSQGTSATTSPVPLNPTGVPNCGLNGQCYAPGSGVTCGVSGHCFTSDGREVQ